MDVLTKDQIEEYVYNSKLVDPNHAVEIVDVLSDTDEVEGLVNQIYRVSDLDSGDSFIIKQVLPFALGISQQTGEFHPMSADRIISESRALTFFNTFWEEVSPQIIRVDRENGIIVMQDLTDYKNLRFELPKAKMYPYFGLEIGSLLAGLRFFTSDLYLDQDSCRELDLYFCNAHHRERMADMIMGTGNVTKKPDVFESGAREICERLSRDTVIQERIEELKDELVTDPYCFCHMDLHIGNILVNERDIKILDSEFSGYGTSYMDLGRLASSFLINFFSWLGRDDNPELKEEMLAYDIQMIYDLFSAYQMTLQSLAPKLAETIYREEELKSLRLMMLSVLLRMQPGVALSYDLSLITTPQVRESIQSQALIMTESVFSNEDYDLDQLIEDLERLMKN